MAEQLVLILGGGRFAVDVADMVQETGGLRLAGFIEGVDPARCREGEGLHPILWIEEIGVYARDHMVVCAIGSPDRRASVEKLSQMGFAFATLVHPKAHVATSARLGPGCIVGPGAVIGAEANLDNHVLLIRGALIGHHTEIGAFSTVCSGVNIGGGCSIGRECFLGIGATVINDIRLGHRCFVNAGSLVLQSVSDGCHVRGSPARSVTDSTGSASR